MSLDDDRFDGWLERRLRNELDPVTRTPAPRGPRYLGDAPSRRRRFSLLTGLGAAVASKAAVGVAATALAVGVSGAVVETAITGSPLPAGVEQQAANVVEGFGGEPAQPPAQAAVPPAPSSPIRAVTSVQSPGQEERSERSPSPPGGRPAAVPPAQAGRTPEPSEEPAERPTGTPAKSPSPRPSGSPSALPTPHGSPAPLPDRSRDGKKPHGVIETHAGGPQE